ncbi:MAG TPA: Uma2 family endonuclease [Thermomicrobiales bacterium]|jgi:Uma2 family endonuclease
MPVTEETYRRVALEDPEGHWELHNGRLREKPAMCYAHNFTMTYLGGQLIAQLDPKEFQVRINAGHLQRTGETCYIPDIIAFPTALADRLRDRPDALETYEVALPFVSEVWSLSTGGYDVDKKLPEYMKRGDLEIWRLHPFERTLTAWRRQPDGTYSESVYRGGLVQPVALPGVAIDLDALFV